MFQKGETGPFLSLVNNCSYMVYRAVHCIMNYEENNTCQDVSEELSRGYFTGGVDDHKRIRFARNTIVCATHSWNQ